MKPEPGYDGGLDAGKYGVLPFIYGKTSDMYVRVHPPTTHRVRAHFSLVVHYKDGFALQVRRELLDSVARYGAQGFPRFTSWSLEEVLDLAYEWAAKNGYTFAPVKE